MGFKQPVRMYSVNAQTRMAREVHFRPELFNYEKTTVNTSQLTGDLGFSGFRVFKAPELDRHDIVSFLGASYFRAVDNTGQSGLSADRKSVVEGKRVSVRVDLGGRGFIKKKKSKKKQD